MGIFSEHAEHYWSAGLPVFPLQVKDKLPVVKGWQNLKNRMPTYEEREAWKETYADGNIGLALGAQSGLIAFDIDTDDPVVLGVLEKVLPPSPWERIGAKGKVWIYRYDGQRAFRIKHRTPEGLKGLVDVQSTGTQIVVPPSIHPKTGKSYYQNCDLVEVLDKVHSLPPNIDEILKDALKEAGYDVSSGEMGAITEFVSSGNRDNQMVSMAGLFARDVLRGQRSLKEVCEGMTTWVENFTQKVHGDPIDPQKGVSKIIEFLTRDVKGKGKALPKGWDEGLDEEQKKKLQLDYFTTEDERWSAVQIEAEFSAQLERTGIQDNNGEFFTLVRRTVQRIANNTDLDGIEEDHLLKFIAAVSGGKVTVTTLRSELRELRAGPIQGHDHREIAAQVQQDLQETGGEIRFDMGRLWQWSGSHWQEMNESAVLQYIVTEYGHLPAAKRANDHKGVLQTMKHIAAKPIRQKEVNGINFVNGFLTERRELMPHHPDYGATYTLGYPYEPDAAAKCQKWLEMLHDYWGDDPDYADKVEALREAICVTLFGIATRKALAFVLYGVAHSGKSRILEIMRALMPDGCSTAIPPQTWGDKFAPAQLAGKLLNVAGELSETQLIDATRFKMIVDGSEIDGQHKNQQMFIFRARCAHWFATNHLPRSRDSSEGFSRRFLFFTFNKKFPVNRRVDNYDQIVVAEERAAIASWAVQAMTSLEENGGNMTDPKSSQDIREHLENALNTVRAFLHDFQSQGRMLLGVEANRSIPNPVTTFDTLWTEYRLYCVGNGVSPVGSKTLALRMSQLEGVFNFKSEKGQNTMGFVTTQYRYLTLVRDRKAAAA